MSDRSPVTRWSVLVALGLATAIMFAVSVRGNYLYGYGLGETPDKGQVFGWASVAADLWKAFGLIAVSILWRARHRKAAAFASIAWLMCLLFGLNSALSLYVQDRTTATSTREALSTSLHDAVTELTDVEVRLNALGHHRSRGEVEAEIEAMLASAVKDGARVRGTLAVVSRNCSKVDGSTTDPCARVGHLRQELAIALEASRLEQQAAMKRAEIARLRDAGGTLPADPVGEFYAWISGGVISVRDVGFGFPLFFALLIEVVTAFGPLTIVAVAEATRQAGRATTETDAELRLAAAGHAEPRLAIADLGETKPDTDVLTWIAERAAPTSGSRAIGLESLHDDFLDWCRRDEREMLSIEQFERAFDRARELPDLAGKIRKFGRRYYGVALQSHATQETGVRRRG